MVMQVFSACLRLPLPGAMENKSVFVILICGIVSCYFEDEGVAGCVFHQHLLGALVLSEEDARR
jgi:hypothetical protein